MEFTPVESVTVMKGGRAANVTSDWKSVRLPIVMDMAAAWRELVSAIQAGLARPATKVSNNALVFVVAVGRRSIC